MANANSNTNHVVIEKAYHNSAEGQLHYRFSRPDVEDGKQRIPVLLLHMSASSSLSCVQAMKSLSARGYSTWAPDMPGFGASFDPERDPPGIEWYSELYHNFFAGFKAFEHGCHVIGHHSGAVIGTSLASKYPGFVRSLTLVGPVFMSDAERAEMRKSYLAPFNQPMPSGEHLTRTWDSLIEKGIPDENVDLLQREALDHLRAWKGRSQIYACVWSYDCTAATEMIPQNCEVLALCARDDVLWPYFDNVKGLERPVKAKEIRGANFGPDLDTASIVESFLNLNQE